MITRSQQTLGQSHGEGNARSTKKGFGDISRADNLHLESQEELFVLVSINPVSGFCPSKPQCPHAQRERMGPEGRQGSLPHQECRPQLLPSNSANNSMPQSRPRPHRKQAGQQEQGRPATFGVNLCWSGDAPTPPAGTRQGSPVATVSAELQKPRMRTPPPPLNVQPAATHFRPLSLGLPSCGGHRQRS